MNFLSEDSEEIVVSLELNIVKNSSVVFSVAYERILNDVRQRQ